MQVKAQGGRRRLEEGSPGMRGVCLRAGLAAAFQPCWQGLVDPCPKSSLCMLPVLPPKEALSKVCSLVSDEEETNQAHTATTHSLHCGIHDQPTLGVDETVLSS